MSIPTLEAKAHELVGQLAPNQLEVVVRLLEVMIHDEDEAMTEEDARAVEASREYFRQGGEGLSFEQAIAECGFTMDQIHRSRTE